MKFNGLIESVDDIRDYEYSAYSGSSIISNTFPNFFQLDPLTIQNQGNWSSCVGCVIATLLEAQYNKKFSKGWNYGVLRDSKETNAGMIHSKALDYLREIGGVPEELFDLYLEMPEMKEECQKFEELKDIAKNYRISGYVKMNQGDSRTGKTKDLQIKEALTKTQKPLFAICPSYFGGSHAITIIGWNDDTDTYIVQNSWGEKYGKKGIGEVDKSEFRQVYQFLYEPIKTPFNDITEDMWFYDDIVKSYMSGLIKGKTETEFKPFENITRAEACVMFNRLMEKVNEANQTLYKLIKVKDKYDQLDK